MHFTKSIFFILILFYFSGCKKKENSNKIREEGQMLFYNTGCVQCHSLSGEKMYGPPLNEILGNEVTVKSADGKISKVIVDRDYIYRGIKNPKFEKLPDYSASIMPVPQITEDKIDILTDYIIEINSTTIE